MCKKNKIQKNGEKQKKIESLIKKIKNKEISIKSLIDVIREDSS